MLSWRLEDDAVARPVLDMLEEAICVVGGLISSCWWWVGMSERG